tara:strand:- start:497 stop:1234 length:738 start_codon:yes stop_codon:yes gene_type:complete
MYSRTVLKLSVLILSLLSFNSCNEVKQVLADLEESPGATSDPSLSEISSGLKAALEKGTSKGVTTLSEAGGYLKNPKIKIPFPPSALKVENTLRDIGLNKEVDRLVNSLNEAAENAVSAAKPLFISAIKSMTIMDAKEILFGADTAATHYLKQTTSTGLKAAFNPSIQESLNKVNATKYWNDLASTYNKIPFVEKVNTDLAAYVTDRAVHGLFLKIAEEEKNIRVNPLARTSTVLEKVFGYAARK